MNKCLYLRIRSHKGIKYRICLKEGSKGHINAEKCYMCEFKEYKKVKPIKKVSKNKQKVSHETYMKVLERDNYRCRLCGTYQNLHLHHINGRGKDLTDNANNCIMLCSHCHLEVVHKNLKKYRPILNEMIGGKNEI